MTMADRIVILKEIIMGGMDRYKNGREEENGDDGKCDGMVDGTGITEEMTMAKKMMAMMAVMLLMVDGMVMAESLTATGRGYNEGEGQRWLRGHWWQKME